ncbi:MAG TPA: recombination mediator RecR [Actinomycetota bacterium]|nr:recombination mediator RecR [Actinomycetota bacterium]
MYQTAYETVLQDLIDQLVRLPAVGPKGAQRIAYHLLETDREEVESLASALLAVKDRLQVCQVCFNTAQGDRCRVCRDETRDPALLCVVEEPKDVIAIERTREFTGRYHVLGGVLDPMRGIGPDQLHTRELFARLADGTVHEVILATDPNTEGEATAAYLGRQLATIGVIVTRLASGLPMGGDLELADEVTLGRAFEGRRRVDA